MVVNRCYNPYSIYTSLYYINTIYKTYKDLETKECSRWGNQAILTPRKVAHMPTCPRCGSDNKGIRQYPYRNKNMRCRDGWHTVGTSKALGRSPLDELIDAVTEPLPVVQALRKADDLLRLVKPKLQSLLDNTPHYGISCRDYAKQAEQMVLDIAKLLGVQLHERGN